MTSPGERTEPRLRLLTSDDVPDTVRLSRQAGWNQTLDDWTRLQAWQPDGCFGLEVDGRVVATLTTTVYRRTLAWIGMVLVDEAYRRRGLARRLMGHALAWLDARAIQTVALDATPVGTLLYDSLGFRPLYTVERWQRAAQAGPSHPPRNRPAPLDLQPDTDLRLDTMAFGVRRHRLLRDLYRADGATGYAIARSQELPGYVLTRPGATHHFVGPLVARTPAHAAMMLDAVLSDVPGTPIFMDVPHPNEAARALAADRGFTVVRSFTRMALGAPPPRGDVSLVFGTAGPEIG